MPPLKGFSELPGCSGCPGSHKGCRDSTFPGFTVYVTHGTCFGIVSHRTSLMGQHKAECPPGRTHGASRPARSPGGVRPHLLDSACTSVVKVSKRRCREAQTPAVIRVRLWGPHILSLCLNHVAPEHHGGGTLSTFRESDSLGPAAQREASTSDGISYVPS